MYLYHEGNHTGDISLSWGLVSRPIQQEFQRLSVRWKEARGMLEIEIKMTLQMW